ncbi:FmdB family zinc ribbon protein [Chloroflexota bacterium]
MPIYEYLCPSCNCEFELRRSFSQSDEAASCPSCQETAIAICRIFQGR